MIFNISASVDPKRVNRGVLWGHYFNPLSIQGSRALLTLFPPHGGCIMQQALQQEETPFLVLGSNLAWVFSSQFLEIKLIPEGLISNSV